MGCCVAVGVGVGLVITEGASFIMRQGVSAG